VKNTHTHRVRSTTVSTVLFFQQTISGSTVPELPVYSWGSTKDQLILAA